MEAWMILLLIASCIFAEGLFLALMPWLQRRHECFSVTVPAAAQADPRLRALKQRYSILMVALTLVLCVVVPVASLSGDGLSTPAGEVRFVILLVGGSLGLCLVSFVVMLAFRRKVQAIKAAEGWRATSSRVSAAVSEGDIPQAISLKWNLAYLPVILMCGILGAVLYDSMPDMVAMNMDLAGNVSNWTPKSPSIVVFPLVVQGFIAACFVFSHWSISKSKRPLDPSAPAASALAYGMFARAQSIYLVAGGLALAAALGVVFMLSSAEVIGLGTAAVMVMAVAMLLVIGAVGISVVYGQAGSRVFVRLQGEDLIPADEDAHWKLGVFYFNPEDPSLFLPERFGVGWTVNLARPAVWAIMIAGVVITVGFVVGISLLVG